MRLSIRTVVMRRAPLFVLAAFIAPASALAQAAPTTAGAANEPAGSPAPATGAASDGTPADDGGIDSLTLRDGTLLRGHVAELHAGRDVTIVLLTGERRTIAWADVASTSGPSFSPAATSPPRPAPVRAPAPAVAPSDDDYTTPAPDRVALIVESVGEPQQVGVSLGQINVVTTRDMGVATINRALCETPCTLRMRPGPFALYTGGNGIREAVTQLVVPETGLRVRMRAPSAAGYVGGFVLTITGVSAVLLGGGLFAVGFSTTGAAMDAAQRATTFGIAGGVTLGVGVAMLAGGIALMVLNPTGIASRRPLAPGETARRDLRLGAAPLPGGVAVAGGLVF